MMCPDGEVAALTALGDESSATPGQAAQTTWERQGARSSLAAAATRPASGSARVGLFFRVTSRVEGCLVRRWRQ